MICMGIIIHAENHIRLQCLKQKGKILAVVGSSIGVMDFLLLLDKFWVGS